MKKSKTPYFITLLLLLLLQLLYVKLVQEPYPAILAPGFGVLKQEDRMVVLWDYKICIRRMGQCEEEMSLDEILPTIPRHVRVAVIQTLVDRSHDASHKEEVRAFLKQKVERRYGLHDNDFITLLKVKLLSNLSTGRIESQDEKELLSLKLRQ